MYKTPFSEQNAKMSSMSHAIAKNWLYPKVFGTEDIVYEYPGGQNDELSMLYDAGMNVDVVSRLGVKHRDLRGRLVVLAQERWRCQDALSWRDITITEWNPASNSPSELYKMAAGIFVYGITDAIRDNGQITKWPSQILSTYVVNVVDLYIAISADRIDFDRRINRRTKQPFLTFKFDDLSNAGLVIYREE